MEEKNVYGWALKSLAIRLVKEPKKLTLGGYALKNFEENSNQDNLSPWVMQIITILRIMEHNQTVRLINFARHESSNVSILT
jgi:hypothetical protein